MNEENKLNERRTKIKKERYEKVLELTLVNNENLSNFRI